jgi:hypothetical protein
MKILNLTQHLATSDQIKAGVVDLPELGRQQLQKLITFDTLPDDTELSDRAHAVASLAAQYIEVLEARDGEPVNTVLIGGAPYFMVPLEIALSHFGLFAVYAFSKRQAVETRNPDGTVTKTFTFKHEGFVPGTMLSTSLETSK